jgi:tetratricopeptide (TPR) repeat protein
MRQWEQVKRGEGRVVLLTGEPGIGKSRITRAFRDRIGSDPHTPLSYFCSPHHQSSALYPHITQLSRAAGIDRGDGAEVRLDKLQSLLAQSSTGLDDEVPLIAALLSIPGGDRYPLPEMTSPRRKERTLAALLDQLKRLATRQPVLVVYEDLQWIDPTSLELLSLAIVQIGDCRVLLLATARPEFAPPWQGHGHVSAVPLNRFTRSDCEALIGGVVKGKALPPEVRDQIIGRTDGVPLFVEELTKTVLESGLLHDVGDHYELTGPLPPLAIPPTLHASLLARLDRLAAVKDVAQIGAVIGREFSYRLIASAAAVPEQNLRGALSQLVQAELIYQRGVPPDATYQFKHALVQDTSYASLVRGRRQQLHGAVARALEEYFSDIVASEPETLAHHLTEAGLTESALSYWLKAGQRATARPAYQEAINLLERGLALLKTLPGSMQTDRRELDFLRALSTPLINLTSFADPTYGALAERITSLAEKVGDIAGFHASLVAQSLQFNATGRYRNARERAERIQAFATRQGDPAMRLRSHHVMGTSLLFAGHFAAARRGFEQALALPKGLVQYTVDPVATFSAYLTWILWIEGFPERAARMQAETFKHAAKLNHIATTAYVHCLAGAQFEQLLGNVPAVLTHTTALANFLAEHGVETWRGMTSLYKGWAVSFEELTAGIALMQKGLEILESKHVASNLPYFMTLLAQVHARAGDLQLALCVLNDAQERARQSEEHIWIAELYRIEGELRRAAGDASTKVEECFARSLAVSRQQGARMFELHAATSLARVWKEQGRRREGHDLLAPVCSWFTEGLDTSALKEAKVLLAEVRA